MAVVRSLLLVVPFAAVATVGVLVHASKFQEAESSASMWPLAAIGTAVPGSVRTPEEEGGKVGEKVERAGRVNAWYVFADGTVAVRLVGQDKEQTFATWFITPADKTETTRFEHLMLATARDVAVSGEELTIAYEQSNEKLGKSLKDAVPIHAVMWGTTLADAEGRPAPRK